MFRKIVMIYALVVFFFCSMADIKAGPPGPPTNPPCWPPPCSIPLDGGITLLIAAGIGLAGKKFHDSRKKSV